MFAILPSAQANDSIADTEDQKRQAEITAFLCEFWLFILQKLDSFES